MITDILPAGAVAVEAFDDDTPVRLFPAEEQLISRSVEKRRREFATARRCAREALAVLGHPPAPLLTGRHREPIWPAGVVGSLTHCAGYRAAVVAPRARLWTVGIDAEPNEPLPDGVMASIADDGESAAVRRLLERDATVRWDRLLFSAKESVYKAWFPLTQRWLGFDEAVVTISPDTGGFEARLLTQAFVDGRALTRFTGRWACARGLVVTAIGVTSDTQRMSAASEGPPAPAPPRTRAPFSDRQGSSH